MIKSKGSSSKKKIKGPARNNRGKGNASKTWYFRPKLKNMRIVLNSILSDYSIEYYEVIINHMRDLVTKLVQNHGFDDGAKRYKIIKDYTMALVEGRHVENPGWLATSEKFKVPSQLGKDFIQLIVDYLRCTDSDKRKKYYQVILTILSIVRIIEGLSGSDYKTITEKASTIDSTLLEEFEEFVIDEIQDAQYFLEEYEEDSIEENQIFPMTFNVTKNGPNGRPKLETAIQEAICLVDSKLFKPFTICCRELNEDSIADYLLGLYEEYKPQIGPEFELESFVKKVHLRKLVEVPDAGFKTRVVAISDFWTQLLLRKLFLIVRRYKRAMFQGFDFVDNQDLGFSLMTDFTNRCLNNEKITLSDGSQMTLDAKHLKSYDISSWTDRFHRDLQKIVMKNLISPSLSEAWAQLVVHCNWYYPRLNRTVKYGQGQGMGTQGSFEIASFTDHLFLKFIKSKSSLRLYEGEWYGKVGDDLWVYDPDGTVKEYYEKINLPINLSKSKVFSNGDSYMEFCSRTLVNGTDCSRISPKIVSKSRDFRYIPNLLGLCSSRNIQIHRSSFESLENISKTSGETYLDILQGWIVGYLMMTWHSDMPYYPKLTYEYLLEMGWIKGDLITKIFDDPMFRLKLMLAYLCRESIDNYRTCQDKLFEVILLNRGDLYPYPAESVLYKEAIDEPAKDALGDYGKVLQYITCTDVNPYDLYHDYTQVLMDHFNSGKILTPKQIIALGRYRDQVLVTGSIPSVWSLLENDPDPDEIKSICKELQRVVNRSNFDGGLIRYDTKRQYDIQFKMAMILKDFEMDKDPLEYLEEDVVRKSLLQIPMRFNIYKRLEEALKKFSEE